MALDKPSTTAITAVTWDEAFREFVLHLRATRADKTVRFYEVQLRQLIRWIGENSAAFDAFGKRHLDRYLAERAKTGEPAKKED